VLRLPTILHVNFTTSVIRHFLQFVTPSVPNVTNWRGSTVFEGLTFGISISKKIKVLQHYYVFGIFFKPKLFLERKIHIQIQFFIAIKKFLMKILQTDKITKAKMSKTYIFVAQP
jgi:hypothetical protein